MTTPASSAGTMDMLVMMQAIKAAQNSAIVTSSAMMFLSLMIIARYVNAFDILLTNRKNSASVAVIM
ncbi:hypothetical protein Bpse01_12270 [Bifidobacterium pseudocatenulatum]|uniref:hypothetical protein n=1 Tax=Bifidobacterium ruminantium TaxID=78346 RepID=UPI001B108E7F|nr:hypothetical protein [Bifidobacterium ruminantium]GDZ43738.1 hypothetical protein MCC02032_01300 [Bifidobacteriaceae bacterium MCC02032]GDZ49585.1 hypothetical protein MCC02034_01210 [Bifidobacteriaceae bacterium MCC02034]GDZ52106.1 hypothetical protein MCC02035_07990 [Bifidobacteriaceae bacterium MCC02035]GDZ55814.1 hypothetical protein MCC01996_05140 [Bifidobacteriaceae bacterium MCC01996]GLZ83358.1 hypothetical protein Bpse01_12270 [Bifidobacterium pseudocatenulatum]